MGKRYLTMPEAAEYLNQKVETLRKWKQRNVGPPWELHVGSVRYDFDKLLKWLDQRPSGPTQPEA